MFSLHAFTPYAFRMGFDAMDTDDDAALARRISGQRDAAAEAALCRRFGPRIRLYGLKHLRSEAAAKIHARPPKRGTASQLQPRTLRSVLLRTRDLGSDPVAMFDYLVAVKNTLGNLNNDISFVASLLAKLGFLPGAPLTEDQWLMLQRDNVPSGDYPGLEAFGIRPTPLAAVAYEWLGRFRGNRFAGQKIHLTASS